MTNIQHVTDCCRVCLRIECTLTSISVFDDDSIKFSDKLLDCVSEVMWLKEDLSSLICMTCIEKLKISYEFRILCLESDQKLQMYTSKLQEINEQNINTINDEHLMSAKNKCDRPPTCKNNLPSIREESEDSQAAEYLQKLFLVNGEFLKKDQNFLQEQKEDQHEIPQQKSLTRPNKKHQNQQILIKKACRKKRQIKRKTKGIQVSLPVPTSTEIPKKKGNPVICAICGKKYGRNTTLRKHMRVHTGEKPFECQYCEKRFHDKSYLKDHIRRHTGEKPFQCSICNKRFTTKGEQRVHMKSHTREKKVRQRKPRKKAENVSFPLVNLENSVILQVIDVDSVRIE